MSDLVERLRTEAVIMRNVAVAANSSEDHRTAAVLEDAAAALEAQAAELQSLRDQLGGREGWVAVPLHCPIGISPDARQFCSAGYCIHCTVARLPAHPSAPEGG